MSVEFVAPTHVIVVAMPSIWRDALVSLLRAQPRLQLRLITASLAVTSVAIANKEAPVVIVDIGLTESAILDFIDWVQSTRLPVHCIVAVDTQQQQMRCIAAGAATLLKGCLDETSLLEAMLA